MVGWHHQFNGYELEQTPGVGEDQGGLACCGPHPNTHCLCKGVAVVQLLSRV